MMLELSDLDAYVGRIYNATKGFARLNKGSPDYLRAIKDVQNLCFALKANLWKSEGTA